MQIKKQQLGLDIEQCTGSKLGKEYIRAVYCHPAYLTFYTHIQGVAAARVQDGREELLHIQGQEGRP